MDIKDRIAVYGSLADSHRKQFDQRRAVEWRVIFAVLSFYVGCAGAVLSKKAVIRMDWPDIVFLATLGSVTSIYLAQLHMANNMNKSIAENAEGALAELLRGNVKLEPNLFSFERHWVSWKTILTGKFASRWGWIWETTTILVFMLASIKVISSVTHQGAAQ